MNKHAQIIERLVELIITLAPDASTREMYGGTVIEMVAADPKTRVAGYFSYANHVSLEFSNGASFTDPDGVLEGKGARRRHVKLREIGDIESTDCAGFLRQAFGI